MAHPVLRGIRLVDLGTGDAARLAATVLCDLGADGVRIGEAGAAVEDAILERGRRWVADADVETLARWLARADVVVDDGGLLARGVDLSTVRLENPGLVILRIPLGTGGGLPSGAAAGAAAGVYAPPLVRRPRWTPIPVAETVAALTGALGAVAALVARTRDGHGQEVVAPLQDAAWLGAETLIGMSHRAPSVWEGPRWASSPWVGNYRCGDGRWVFVHLGLAHHLAIFVDLLAHEGLIRMSGALKRAMSADTRHDPSAVGSPAEARAIHDLLAELFDARPADVWERLLGEAGLCCTMVRTGPEWRTSAQAVEAGHVVRLEDPALGPTLQPGAWIRVGEGSVRARREGKPSWGPRANEDRVGDPRPPLAGLRVLDFTQVIAGPVAGRTLAELGAEVIRVEHPRFAPAWFEAFYVLFNAGKRSVGVDLDAEKARRILEELQPDVVLTGWRSGVDGRLGLDPESVRAVCPDALVVRLNAYGQEGPWAGWPGWEQTVQAASGLQADYGGDTPELVPLPVNDACTGLATALGAVTAILHRARGRGPVDVHTSLAATATWLQRGWLFAPSGRVPRDERGPSLGSGPARRFVRARDGWLWLEGEPEAIRQLVGVAPTQVDAVIRRQRVEHWLDRARVVDGVVVAPWRTLGGAADSADSRVVRVAEPGLGSVSKIPLGLELERTPVLEPTPAPVRGVDGSALLDGVVPVVAPDEPQSRDLASRIRHRARWARSTARWGVYLARTRVLGI